MTTSEWLDRLAPKANAIVAAGTCATYDGIHAMAGNDRPGAAFPRSIMRAAVNLPDASVTEEQLLTGVRDTTRRTDMIAALQRWDSEGGR